MNNLEAIYNISDAKKNVGTIRDIDKDNADLELKIQINLKRRTALSIKISKALCISMDRVRTLVGDRSGATFDNIADQIVIKVADFIYQSKNNSFNII